VRASGSAGASAFYLGKTPAVEPGSFVGVFTIAMEPEPRLRSVSITSAERWP